MEEIVDACIEWPRDERNIQYVEVFGSSEVLPTSMFLNDGQIQDQNKEWWKYGCVFYSTSNGSNLMNFIEWSSVRIPASKLCEKAVEEGLLDVTKWAWIISGPKLTNKLGYIDWYAEISTLYEMKHSIANKRPIVCGSNQIDWSSATKENEWTVHAWKAYGHAILLDGYDDNNEQFRIRQSYDKWDKSHQWIGYNEALSLLYPTRFSLIDKSDPIITNYKKQIMENITIESARIAFEAGIWNWLDPQKPASREETAAMIQRAFDKLSK